MLFTVTLIQDNQVLLILAKPDYSNYGSLTDMMFLGRLWWKGGGWLLCDLQNGVEISISVAHVQGHYVNPYSSIEHDLIPIANAFKFSIIIIWVRAR